MKRGFQELEHQDSQAISCSYTSYHACEISVLNSFFKDLK